MDKFQTVCRIDEIPVGEARAFSLGEMMIAIFNVDGEFLALDDCCPHAGASLARGYVEGETVRCRIHHWGFCLRSGVYVDEDNRSLNARSFPVRIVNDAVQVCLG